MTSQKETVEDQLEIQANGVRTWVVNQSVTIELPLLAWTVVHGHLLLALKDPLNKTVASSVVIAELLKTLEEVFEKSGLAKPPQGWRGDR